MSAQPARKPRRATYVDLGVVPRGKVAELIDGQLSIFPRPAPPHLNAEGGLVAALRDLSLGRRVPSVQLRTAVAAEPA